MFEIRAPFTEGHVIAVRISVWLIYITAVIFPETYRTDLVVTMLFGGKIITTGALLVFLHD